MSAYDRIRQQQTFTPGEQWEVINTIDMHTGGEPLRVILSGYPEIKGNSILEKRAYLKTDMDWLRTALMFEPRGHHDMYGCLLTPPERPDSDFGVIFMHNEGYSTMCGHATIAIGKLAIEMGWVEKVNPVTALTIDAPCGQIRVFVDVESNNYWVRFYNVPSFVAGIDLEDDIPGLGEIKYDIAYGGAFYAYVPAAQLGLSLQADNYSSLKEAGMTIKRYVAEERRNLIRHPFESDLSFLYGTIFTGDSEDEGVHSRNVCIFADGEVDRSPTGSGVSGRMAIHHKKREIPVGERVKIESILGTCFTAQVVEELTFGSHEAVVPEVGGTAYVVGRNTFFIDPEDPLKEGFILK